MEDFHNLLALMVVVWVMGKIFRAISLPVVFGELLGGIIVGPLILNIVDPSNSAIKVLSELGIFFLMLHAGLETDVRKLLKSLKSSFPIAILGLMLPFFGGFFALKYLDFPTIEALFIGVAISATSIAISVRLLKDCKIRATQVADKILAAAILSDIIILVIFSTLVRVVQSGTIDTQGILILMAKILIFFGIVIWGGLKLSKYTKKYFANKGFTLTLIIALSLGYFAEWIGLHAIIGAFLAGLFIQEELMDDKIFKKIEDRIYGLSYGFLGPIFFTTIAFSIDFQGIINAPKLFLLLFSIAYIGKFMGSFLGAIIKNESAKNSGIIGLTMNSRGALDLVIISIGLKYQIIDQQMFSILVLMAFSATFLTIMLMRITKRSHQS